MKIKIKKVVTKKADAYTDRPYTFEKQNPIFTNWRDLTQEKKLDIYFKFKFVVCWDCGKYADTHTLVSIYTKKGEDPKGVYVCERCKFWRMLEIQKRKSLEAMRESIARKKAPEKKIKIKIKVGKKIRIRSKRNGKTKNKK